MKPKPKHGKPDSVRLQSKSGKNDRTSVYGIAPVMELLRSGSRRIEKVLISEGIRIKKFGEIVALAREHHVRSEKVAKREFLKFVDHAVNHQGVVAVTSAAEYYDADALLSEVIDNTQSLSLIFDGIEDPGNLGALIRTAEVVGVDGVFIPERRAAGLTEAVTRSSAGATEYVKVAKVMNVNRLIDDLKDNNVWVIGASGDADMDYWDWDWRQPSVLVLGSEGRGLHRLTSEKCDVLVKVPMYGKIDSLNVSVAGGVILYEARRQRSKT